MLFGCYVMCRPFLFSLVFSNAFAGATSQFIIPWMFVHGFLYFIFPFFLLFTLLCAPKRCQSAGAISRPRAERCFGSMVGPAPCCTQKKCTQDAVFGQKKCSYHTRYTRTRLALRCCCSAGHMVRVFNHACPRLRVQGLINSKRRKHITPAELSRIDSQLAELRENGLESFLADAAEEEHAVTVVDVRGGTVPSMFELTSGFFRFMGDSASCTGWTSHRMQTSFKQYAAHISQMIDDGSVLQDKSDPLRIFTSPKVLVPYQQSLSGASKTTFLQMVGQVDLAFLCFHDQTSAL